MGKAKTRTISERFGFFDDDLKTMKHDEICKEILKPDITKKLSIYLSNDDNECIELINNKFYQIIYTFYNYEETPEKTNKGDNFSVFIKLKTGKELKFLEKNLVIKDNNYEVEVFNKKELINDPRGNILLNNIMVKNSIKLSDIYISKTKPWEYNHYCKFVDIKSLNYKIKTQFEYPVMNGGYIIGFIDIVICIESLIRELNKVFYIEVKTKKENFGQLMRQLNMYRAYINGNYCIVSAEQFSIEDINILKSQNINYIDFNDLIRR